MFGKLVPISCVSDGLTKVLSEDKFSLVTSSAGLELSRNCDVESVGTLGLVHYGLAFRRGSSLTRRVNSVLLSMKESGEIKTLLDKWIPEGTCQDTQPQPLDPLPFCKLLDSLTSSKGIYVP